AFAAQRQAWEAASGLKLEEIESLELTLHDQSAKPPRASFVVKTKEKLAPEELLTRWGNPAPVQENSETYYTGPMWAFYISHAPEDERTFAMGQAGDIKRVASAAGGPPLVFRDFERLRRMTDSERQFTLLFDPQFLLGTNGQALLAPEQAKLQQALAWLMGDNVRAACLSGNLGDEFYLELRMLA